MDFQSQTRTWCKYNDCSLEKLEQELEKLKKVWGRLTENWSHPKDYEDVFRVYPLLDTTAALARKRLVKNGKRNNFFVVKTVKPSTNRSVETDDYLYADEKNFFNGINETSLLANIVSTFLHGSNYEYMDTRKTLTQKTDYEIYIFIKTDILCPSCIAANIENPDQKKVYFREKTTHICYNDCTCGIYIELQSYIDSMTELIKEEIKKRA